MKLTTRLARHKRCVIVHAAGAAVVALAFGAGYFFGVAPVESLQERQQSLRTSLKAKSTEETDLRRRHRDAERAYEELAEFQRTRGVKLQPASQLNAQVRDIAALASEMHVEVDSLNASTPITESQFTRIPVRLAGRARAQDASEFMRAIRERFSDVIVRTFEIRADLSGSGALASVQLEIEWYAAKPER